MSDNGNDSPSRRTVLEGTAGAVGAATIPATASAGETSSPIDARRKRLEARREIPAYYDEETIQKQLKLEAEALLEALAAKGFISEASWSAFDRIEDTDRYAKTTEDGKVAMTGDVHTGTGTKTAHLTAYATTDRYAIDLHVMPEADVSFAVVVGRSGDSVYLVDPSNPVTTNDVSAQSCTGDMCEKVCDPTNPVVDPYVIKSQGSTTCSNTCVDNDPSCSECPDQDKCNDNGGGGW